MNGVSEGLVEYLRNPRSRVGTSQQHDNQHRRRKIPGEVSAVRIIVQGGRLAIGLGT